MEEMAAVQMAVSLLSERPRNCPDEHLALLLQNVYVLCRTSSNSADVVVGADTVNFALGAILQDEHEVSHWEAAKALIAQRNRFKWTAASLLATEALLAPLYPGLRACSSTQHRPRQTSAQRP